LKVFDILFGKRINPKQCVEVPFDSFKSLVPLVTETVCSYDLIMDILFAGAQARKRD